MNRAALALLSSMILAPASAAQLSGGVPTILQPQDGATVTSPLTVIVAMQGGMEMAGGMHHAGAHLHLVIDSPLPVAGARIPVDSHHIHFMHGQTQTTIDLAPGKHTLQLILGNVAHTVAPDAPHSSLVTFTVKPAQG